MVLQAVHFRRHQLHLRSRYCIPSNHQIQQYQITRKPTAIQLQAFVNLQNDSQRHGYGVKDWVMREAMQFNPFRPGFGKEPPAMGHRPEIERRLLNILYRLQSGEKGPEGVYIYGPRGNGKTVLLNWLRRRAKEGPPLSQVKLSPAAFDTDEALQKATESAGKELHRIVGRFLESTSVEFAGIGVQLKLKEAREGLNLPTVGNGLLITLDEAHKVPAARLGRFLDAVQEAGDEMPVAFVLAGTPGLEDTLRKSGASYWSRGLQLGVGRLNSVEAEKVIAEPFYSAGITVGEGIAAELAEEAEFYPFFLQVYGEAAWQAMASAGKCHLGPRQAEEAVRRGVTRREFYYNERYEEFLEANALDLAYAVALRFRESNGQLTEKQMIGLLNRDHGDGLDLAGRRRLLRARGYIWRMQPRWWEPGIPSLMDYVIEITQA